MYERKRCCDRHLQLVGTQQFLVGGRAAHGDGRAAGNHAGAAGKDVRGHQAHTVRHGGQVGGVAQTAGPKALAHWKRLLYRERKTPDYTSCFKIFCPFCLIKKR